MKIGNVGPWVVSVALRRKCSRVILSWLKGFVTAECVFQQGTSLLKDGVGLGLVDDEALIACQ
jgi:hypothetical protein